MKILFLLAFIGGLFGTLAGRRYRRDIAPVWAD